MKITVLFVDDDPLILSGLKRMLRGVRNDWAMEFAESGQAALERMSQMKFDVVVSDMRMPKMDGSELLQSIKEKYPSTVRIILSGYANQEIVLRTVGPAHQYLAKPCEADILIDTVNRSCALRSYLGNKGLRKFISSLENLPTPPDIYSRLIMDLDDPHSNAKSIAKIISSDIALTAGTLKLTNSAFFGLPHKVENLEKAVATLGTDTIRALVLVAGFYSMHEGDPKTLGRIKVLSHRCLSIGVAAKKVALENRMSQLFAEQACCAGVLSHVGTLALIANKPEQFAEVIRRVEENNIPIYEAEKEVFGASHQELGAYLLGLWGFTDPILEAVAFHHEPDRAPTMKATPLTMVHIAQNLVKQTAVIEDNEDVWSSGLDEEYLSRIGISERVKDFSQIVGLPDCSDID